MPTIRVRRCVHGIHAALLLSTLLPTVSAQSSTQNPTTDDPNENPQGQSVYQYADQPSRDGIGKIYMGREISQVMGHLGAGWLERPEREAEEKPAALMQALGLKSGYVVMDIGAGTGYFTRRIAKAVAPEGKVYAVDIQPEMLALLRSDLEERDITNVSPIQGTVTDPKVPESSCDLGLMVDVYHEFSHPHEMLRNIVRALKPGGRLVFVEYRAEDPSVPIKRLHKMSEAQVKKEAAAHGLQWIGTDSRLPRQHIILFKKPSTP